MAEAVPQIFINYRRDDSRDFANLLGLYFKTHFGGDSFFLDTATIPAGAQWPDRIQTALQQAKVVLVVIGKSWLTLQGKGGRRRIDLPDDWVRRELEHALANKKVLIPILAEDARFPEREDWPESIARLGDYEQAVFRYTAIDRDFAQLAEALCGHGVVPTNQAGTVSGDPAFYLTDLRTKYGHIDIKGIQTRNPKAQTFAINDLYITLTYTARSAENSTAVRSKTTRGLGQGAQERPPGPEGDAESRPVDLKQALKHPRLLVMGDPGSGKTTFLHKIACEAAENLACPPNSPETSTPSQPLPLLINIAGFCGFLQQETKAAGRPDPESPAWLEEYLAKLAKDFDWQLTLANFQNWLKATEGPGTLLLLDGLDEAPNEKLRKRVQNIVSSFSQIASRRYPAVRIVITSRPLEMTGTIDLEGFEIARVNPLDDGAILTFLRKWCDALHADSPERAGGHLAELLADLNARPEIRRMARNPVMLTALAVVHWNEGRMPEQRAELYASILHWLDQARSAQREERTPDLPSALPVFQDLALGMQTDARGMQKGVTLREAAEMVRRLDQQSGRVPAAGAVGRRHCGRTAGAAGILASQFPGISRRTRHCGPTRGRAGQGVV
jgi:Cdc6-like AAA superfamily ATPase